MPANAIASSILPLHILGGVLALVFGYTALYARKGGALHRKTGLFFVFAMVALSLSGALMEALNKSFASVNEVAGLMTFYFVATALLTVRPHSQAWSWVDGAGVLLAIIVSVLAFAAGFDLANRGRPEAAPSFIFGIVGLLGALGDMRMMGAGGIHGRKRIARHLWRMCFAMWVAAASFFWGPPNRVPEVIRIPTLQAVAVLIPIVAMVYWLWRIRGRHALQGIVTIRAAHVPALEKI